jgi:hypothetical protein
MLSRMAPVITYVSEELNASIIREIGIGELGAKFLRYVGCYKIHTTKHLRRRHSSYVSVWATFQTNRRNLGDLSAVQIHYACIREICLLWAQPVFDIFHYLIIFGAFRSQTILHADKEAVVKRKDNRAVRRVVKHFPDKSATKCLRMLTHTFIQEPYKLCQYSTPYILSTICSSHFTTRFWHCYCLLFP